MIQSQNPDYSSKKTMGMVLGLILIIIGAIIVVIGLTYINSPSPSIDDPNWEKKSSESFQKFGMGAGMTMGGFILISIGVFIIYFTNIRRMATYMAVETAPAVTISSRALGSGLTQGINDSGGIHMDHGNTKPAEVVKVKCRKCGYLDTEDATFCSKCGEKL